MKKDRIEYIDVAKGISISVVALFHSKLQIYIPEIISPMTLFMLPLFFFLSGFFFTYSSSPIVFILKKAESLLKPYFLILIALSVFSFLSGAEDFMQQLKGIFYGNGPTIKWTPLWFLPHLFAIYLLSYFLFYYCLFGKLRDPIKCIFLVGFVFIGIKYIDFFWYNPNVDLLMLSEMPGLPFSIDIIFISLFFFVVGYELKERFIVFSFNIYIFVISVFLYFCISVFLYLQMRILI
jgi:fucose 4-O-acetylase-like acetyltransferase